MVRTKGYGTTQKSSQGGMGYRPNFVGRMDEETLDPKIRRRLLMSTCSLTQRDFTPSTRIVCDRIGWLYDKEALIKALLDKTLPVDFDHLTTLKDVVDVKFDWNGESMLCRLSKRELNDGVTKSSVMWPCGCLLSNRFIEEIQAIDSSECPNCSSKVDSRVEVYPDENVLEAQKLNAVALRTKKKRKNAAPEETGKRVDPRDDKFKIYSKIFHKDGDKEKVTDAFGRGFASKGIGI
jgi:hypothetical protein